MDRVNRRCLAKASSLIAYIHDAHWCYCRWNPRFINIRHLILSLVKTPHMNSLTQSIQTSGAVLGQRRLPWGHWLVNLRARRRPLGANNVVYQTHYSSMWPLQLMIPTEDTQRVVSGSDLIAQTSSSLWYPSLLANGRSLFASVGFI